jgi:hypothetical protein
VADRGHQAPLLVDRANEAEEVRVAPELVGRPAAGDEDAGQPRRGVLLHVTVDGAGVPVLAADLTLTQAREDDVPARLLEPELGVPDLEVLDLGGDGDENGSALGHVQIIVAAMRTTIAAPFLAVALSLVAASSWAKPGDWRQVGKGGDWNRTKLAAADGGKLYTIEKDGGFFVTDLTSGEWKQLGKPEYQNTRAMWAEGGKVVTLETTGSLFLINPADGSWSRIGKEGEWNRTAHGALVGGQLYTVEKNGQLFVTDLAKATWTELGKGDYAKTKIMTGAGGKLFTLEDSGTVYAINTDGTWAQLGKDGDYKRTFLAAAMDGKLYTIERNGQLFETDTATGKWSELGKDYKNTQFLVATGGQLYTIGGGTLYAIDVK